MKLFGATGLVCGAVGVLSGFATIYMKLFEKIDMTGNPLFMLSIFSVMVGIQFFGMGMLGELGARIYYQVRDGQSYAVRRTMNLSKQPPQNSEEKIHRRVA